MSAPTATTPREVAELVRRMVKGDEGIVFADLFAPDGVMEYPYVRPGDELILRGQDAIRAFFESRDAIRAQFEVGEVTSVIYQTDDPEVVITQIHHRGFNKRTNSPYYVHAVGIIRVRDGKIVHYTDYMNPLVIAQLTGEATAEPQAQR